MFNTVGLGRVTPTGEGSAAVVRTRGANPAELVAEFQSGGTKWSHFILAHKGANIASASTTNIGAAGTATIQSITGTTTIASFGTPPNGNDIRFVNFTGVLTLTHNATSLILPGGTNITTAAGDCAIFIHEGSGNWRCWEYSRAAGIGTVTHTGTLTSPFIIIGNGAADITTCPIQVNVVNGNVTWSTFSAPHGSGGLINFSGSSFVGGFDGGSIVATGGRYADAGSINLNGDHGEGGSIDMYGSPSNIGINSGSIDMHGDVISGGNIYTYDGGGDINTSGDGSNNGGFIATYANGNIGGNIDTHGETEPGGNIDTSDGGGDITTNGVGGIGLGSAGTRTSIKGGAVADYTINLPTGDGSPGYVIFTDGAGQWGWTAVGTVTSVDASGGTTGLTFSGGPITTSGTLTLAGTLVVANGGTGTTTSTGTGSVVLSGSPALTGTPTSPTAAPGTNTTQIASTAFVSAAIALAVTGLLHFIGTTNCSANPNYPAGVIGDSYIVSVAGKIGGASGTVVDVGDWYICQANNAGGTEAAVGTSWGHMEHNLVGALLASNNLSDLANANSAITNLGGASYVGSGGLVRAVSPILTTPDLGTPSAGVLTNCTGTATGLTAGAATILATGHTIAMTGDVVWTSPSFNGSGNVTATSTIQANAITYAKMQAMSASTLLGNPTGGSAIPSEITLRASLSFSTTTVGINLANSNTFTAAQGINVASTTAFKVEQNGVFNNTFVVDTSTPGVGIGTTPSLTNFLNILGPQPASTSGSPTGTSAGAFNLVMGAGGNTTNAGTNTTGGSGGLISLFAGAGGTATAGTISNTGGSGGTFTNLSGSGASATAAGTVAANGGIGGDFSFVSGGGGGATASGSGNATGGVAGFMSVSGASGGNATGSTGTNLGGAGTAFSLTGGGGGSATGASSTTATGGDAGTFIIGSQTTGSNLGGTASGATGTNTGGAGIAMTINSSRGGPATGGTAAVSGVGGTITVNTGSGGAATNASSTNTGARGGNLTWTTGAGGAGTGSGATNIGGNAGSWSITLGTGGASNGTTSTSTGGNGGSWTIILGTGGATTTGTTVTAGNGGSVTYTFGTGGAASNTGNTTQIAGNGGSGTWTFGNGGACASATTTNRTRGSGGSGTWNAGVRGGGTAAGSGSSGTNGGFVWNVNGTNAAVTAGGMRWYSGGTLTMQIDASGFGVFGTSAGQQTGDVGTAMALFGFLVSPVYNSSGVICTTTNNNAAAGYLGEYIESVINSGLAVSLTTNTAANITSISLTAGDWDVTGGIGFAQSGTTASLYQAGSSTTSATLPVTGEASWVQYPFAVVVTGDKFMSPIPTVRYSLSGTTTIYLVASATFSAGTVSAFGTIRARRIR